MAETVNNSEADTGSTGAAQKSTLGAGFVGLSGLLAIAIYLVVFAVSDFYVLVKVWPPPTDSSDVYRVKKKNQNAASLSNSNSDSASVDPKAPEGAAADEKPQDEAGTESGPQFWKTHFFTCGSDKNPCWISLNTSLFLISMLAGALGSLLHSFRSVYWYVGNRGLRWSWAMMYVLLPFGGGILATIFYIIVRGGFMQSATLQNSSPFGFAALGALVGMFSEEAVKKLKQVAGTVFAAADTGNDHVAPTPPSAAVSTGPTIVSIAPASGPAGTVVVLTGSNFATAATVNFDGEAAPVVVGAPASATSITVTAPAHAAGPVDVAVENGDGKNFVLAGAFTYV